VSLQISISISAYAGAISLKACLLKLCKVTENKLKHEKEKGKNNSQASFFLKAATPSPVRQHPGRSPITTWKGLTLQKNVAKIFASVK
jgi:hypothetical protein